MEKKKTESGQIEIAGLPLKLYLPILVLTLLGMYTDAVPGGMVGGVLVLMVLGEGLNTLGRTVPGIRTYLGGSVICILGGAVIASAGLVPAGTSLLLDEFVNEGGFLVFYIAAICS